MRIRMRMRSLVRVSRCLRSKASQREIVSNMMMINLSPCPKNLCRRARRLMVMMVLRVANISRSRRAIRTMIRWKEANNTMTMASTNKVKQTKSQNPTMNPIEIRPRGPTI